MKGRAFLAPALLIAVSLLWVPATGLGAEPSGKVPDKITFDDKIASMKKAGVGPVVYTHALHEKRSKCADCHPGLFKDKRGANDISMKANMDGKYCGSPNCHNSKKAFPLYECAKCHTNVATVK